MIEDTIRDGIRAWLYDSGVDKDAILEELPDETDGPRELVRSCLTTKWEARERGVHLGEGFEMPHLRERYPDEQLNFCVPDSYDASEQSGLLVLLHGGGTDTPREAAQKWFEDEGGYPFGEVLRGMDCITVTPGNLQLPTHKRWSNPTSDAYVLAVVEEASYRYNIDPDRVWIAGQSMGGFGAFHIVQTIGDRFACVGCHAGAWNYGFFEGLRSVDFYFMQGANDFVPGVRPRWTEAAFARMAHAVLSGYHIEHTYVEHEGGHSFTDSLARDCFLGFLEHAPTCRRDAFPAEIATCSHKGAFRLYEAPHWAWLSLGRTQYGTVEIDHLQPTEALPSYCTTSFRHYTIRIPGGTAHARNEGDNHLALQVRNVDDLTVWVSREMVDFDRPVRVTVNGEVAFEGMLRPSLSVALQSYDRRRDPGMLFEARIDLNLRVDDWARQQELWPEADNG